MVATIPWANRASCIDGTIKVEAKQETSALDDEHSHCTLAFSHVMPT